MGIDIEKELENRVKNLCKQKRYPDKVYDLIMCIIRKPTETELNDHELEQLLTRIGEFCKEG